MIIAVDIRFTAIDVGILLNCIRSDIPASAARTKADSHTSNIMNDDRGDDEEDDSQESIQKRLIMARDKFVT